MMTEERRGQIALMFLKLKLQEEGVRLRPNDFRRQVGNWAKALGITTEEAMAFAEGLVRELVEVIFSPNSPNHGGWEM
ncbi:MAG: hypothetical protein GX627_00885 [Parcubacteria group bacterium]|nr:hypothetical protein [Parcubacteria group bacterium]